MPLIKCPDCKKEISESAWNCVHCGWVETKSVFMQELGFDGKLFRFLVFLGLIIEGIGFAQLNPLLTAGRINISSMAIIFLLLRSR